MMNKIFNGRGFEDSTDWYTRYFYYIDSMRYFAGSGEEGCYHQSGCGILHDHTDGRGYGPKQRNNYDCIPIELIQYWK